VGKGVGVSVGRVGVAGIRVRVGVGVAVAVEVAVGVAVGVGVRVGEGVIVGTGVDVGVFVGVGVMDGVSEGVKVGTSTKTGISLAIACTVPMAREGWNWSKFCTNQGPTTRTSATTMAKAAANSRGRCQSCRSC
jgi:hypothetical protein